MHVSTLALIAATYLTLSLSECSSNINHLNDSDDLSDPNVGLLSVIRALYSDDFTEASPSGTHEYQASDLSVSTSLLPLNHTDFMNSVWSDRDTTELVNTFRDLDSPTQDEILATFIDNERGRLNAQLFEAIEENNVSKAKRLIASGVDLSALNENGLNALHYAAKSCNLEIMTQLLQSERMNVEAVTADKYTETALHILARNADSFPERAVEGAKLLIDDYKAKVDALTRKHKQTPLFVAVSNSNNVQLVQYLLEHGADPNHADPTFKSTPLHVAMKNCNEHIIESLLSYGANAEAPNAFLRQPIHAAASNGCVAGVDSLFARGVNLNSQIPAQDEKIGSVIVPEDSEQTYRGCTPLHFAAMEKNNLEVIQRLLDLSADPEIPTYCGVKAERMAVAFELNESAELISNFIAQAKEKAKSQKQKQRWHLRI